MFSRYTWCVAFGLLNLLLTVDASSSELYFLQKNKDGSEGTRLLIANISDDEILNGCEIIENKREIRPILTRLAPENIQEVKANEMDEIIEECKSVEKVSSPDIGGPMSGPTKTTTEGYDGWNVIFPGTKWCGAGDIAKNYDDLGILADTDKCCRAHDLCNDTIAPGAEKYNLKNTSPFTKLSCKCDTDFYNCLEKVDTMISNKIGNVYFNILRRSCYEYDYPLSKRCKSYRSFLKITCKEYSKDTRAPRTYQWKNAKLYKKLPIPGPFSVEIRGLPFM